MFLYKTSTKWQVFYMKMIRLIMLLLSAIAISWILNVAGMILPWLFGSMIATFLFIRFITKDFYYPKWLGNVGVFVIGFEIGSTFTVDAMQEMIGEMGNIIIITLLIIGLSLSLRSEEHTSELQSRGHLVCRLLLERKKEAIH